MLNRRALVAAACASVWASGATAAAFPTKAVTIVVPYPAGGPSDIVARALADKLSARWSQPVVVENKTGANGIIATEAVARSPADGHTLLLHLTGYIQNASLYRKLPYDPSRDFKPLVQIGTQPMALAVSESSPIRSMDDLGATARNTAAAASYGSFGAGSTGHIFGELLNANLKTAAPHVPYRGESPMLMDLIAGRVTYGFVSSTAAVNRMKDQSLRILAVSGTRRFAQLPQVPTLTELGFSGYDIVGWYGLFAPVRTPASTSALIEADVLAVLGTPEIKERLKELAIEPTGLPASAFGAELQEDAAKWDRLIKRFQITLD